MQEKSGKYISQFDTLFLSSFQPRFVYNFSKIKTNFPPSAKYWYLRENIFTYFLINRVCIFLLIRILVRTMSRKIHGLCIKSFADLVKYHYFLRFRNRSRNIFVVKREKNLFFIFLIMLPKSVHMDWKFLGSLESSITFVLKSISLETFHTS